MVGKKSGNNLDDIFGGGGSGENSGGGGANSGGPSQLSVQFFEGANGVKAYKEEFNVDLTRHKPSRLSVDPIKDKYTDAIKNHAPESSKYPVIDRFSSHGEAHRVRREYLERHKYDMAEAQSRGEKQFGYKLPFKASDGKYYIFTFRFDDGIWKEITGFPSNRGNG